MSAFGTASAPTPSVVLEVASLVAPQLQQRPHSVALGRQLLQHLEARARRQGRLVLVHRHPLRSLEHLKPLRPLPLRVVLLEGVDSGAL